MLKFIAITASALTVAGSWAILERRPAPTNERAALDNEASPPQRIFATGIVEGRTEDVELRPEASGRVVDVLVSLGEWVEANQVLLRLDDRSQRAQVAASLAKLHLAEANLERLVNGAREAEREEARALLSARQARLRQARLTWGRVQALRAQDAIAQQEADDQEGIVQTLAAEVEAAKARLRQLEQPAREDELRAAQARVAAAQAEYELATIALDRTALRAPTRAQVLEVNIEPGELIAPERPDPVIVLADTSALRVRAFVEEIDAPRIATGASAVVTADGLPGRTFAAAVRSVSPRMNAKSVSTDRPDELYDSKVREVLLDVVGDRPARALIVGLRVDVDIDAAHGDDVSK